MTEVTISAPAGDYRGYLSEPATPAPWPGVVVLHEAYGLDADIRHQADRFAGRGYLAVAPDLYSRGPKPRCLLSVFRSMATGAGPAFDAIDAARRLLADRPDCTGRVGVIGFCQGGRFALMAAPRYDFAAAAVNYGPLPGNLDHVLQGSCPVVASYGGKDRTNRGAAAKLEASLTRLRVDHDVKEYPAASHSFLNVHDHGLPLLVDKVTGFGYRDDAAADAWRRIDAFFDRHLRG